MNTQNPPLRTALSISLSPPIHFIQTKLAGVQKTEPRRISLRRREQTLGARRKKFILPRSMVGIYTENILFIFPSSFGKFKQEPDSRLDKMLKPIFL